MELAHLPLGTFPEPTWGHHQDTYVRLSSSRQLADRHVLLDELRAHNPKESGASLVRNRLGQ